MTRTHFTLGGSNRTILAFNSYANPSLQLVMYGSLDGSGRYGTSVLHAIVLHIHVVLKIEVQVIYIVSNIDFKKIVYILNSQAPHSLSKNQNR